MNRLIAAAAASILGSALFGDVVLPYTDTDQDIREHMATWPIPVDEETAKEVADLHLLKFVKEKRWEYLDSIPVTTNVGGTVVTIGYLLRFNNYQFSIIGQPQTATRKRPSYESIGIALGLPRVVYYAAEVNNKESGLPGQTDMKTFLKYIGELNVRDIFRFTCPTPRHWLKFERSINDPRWRSILVASLEYKDKAINYSVLALPFVWDVPEAVQGLKYDGTEKTGVIPTGSYYLTGNKATEPGDYVATATISNNVGCFFGGSIDPIQIPWSIAP